MSELTRIYTVQITMISDADEAPDAESAKKDTAKIIKDGLRADDVNVVEVQDFLIDK